MGGQQCSPVQKAAKSQRRRKAKTGLLGAEANGGRSRRVEDETLDP